MQMISEEEAQERSFYLFHLEKLEGRNCFMDGLHLILVIWLKSSFIFRIISNLSQICQKPLSLK